MVSIDFDLSAMPKHVAIIMDGNGRWATQRGKPRVFGHQKSFKAVHSAVEFAAKNNIKILTLYAFSQENWSRPQDEIDSLMSLFMKALNSEIKKFHKYNICVKFIGDLTVFSQEMQEKIEQSQELTRNNTGLKLNIALNYSARWEMLQAVANISEQSNITQSLKEREEAFTNHLAIKEDVDLLIRTSGEMRLSNFLLWQCAYAEFYFTDVLWPDFNEAIFSDAICQFQLRNRRFGGV